MKFMILNPDFKIIDYNFDFLLDLPICDTSYIEHNGKQIKVIKIINGILTPEGSGGQFDDFETAVKNTKKYFKDIISNNKNVWLRKFPEACYWNGKWTITARLAYCND